MCKNEWNTHNAQEEHTKYPEKIFIVIIEAEKNVYSGPTSLTTYRKV